MDFEGIEHSYAVEVSGWDASENFFVETTGLTWTAEGTKQISLHQRVREGSVIFVRLMQPVASADSYPIACQTMKVVERGAGGAIVRLSQLHPRSFFKDSVRQMNATKVA